MIVRKREKYGNKIERYTEQNNKYTLTIENRQNVDNNILNGSYLDSIYLFIKKDSNISDDVVNKMKQFCHSNEYDTESIEDDIKEINNGQSNIFNHINNKLCIQLIKECIKSVKCMLFIQSLFIYI